LLFNVTTPFPFSLFSKNYMRTFLAHQRAAWTAIALLAILGVLTSCTVTTSVSVDPALLTRSGGWKFDKFTIGTAPSNQTNLWTGMLVVFTSTSSNGNSGTVTFTPTDAAKTASNLPIGTTFTGTWAFNDARSMITLANVTILNGTVNTAELSSTTLRFNTQVNGETIEYRFTAN
jgi:hypothetical protein